MFDAQNVESKWAPYNHNKKRHPYMYFCKNCNRSFMSPDHTDECKFCGKDIIELRDELFNKLVKNQKFHYHCKICEKDFIIHDKRKFCDCGLPVKKLTLLEKPGITDTIKDLLPGLKKLEIVPEPIEKENVKDENTGQKAVRIFNTKKIRMPARPKRYKEEMPTHYVEKDVEKDKYRNLLE